MSIIRYRYSGEDWTQIEGDNYTTEPIGGQCYAGYSIFFEVVVRWLDIRFDENRRAFLNGYEDYVKEVSMTTPANTRVYRAPYFPEEYIQHPTIIYSHDGSREVLTTEWLGSWQIYAIAENPDGSLYGLNAIADDYETPKGRGSFLYNTIENVRYTPRTDTNPDCEYGCEFKVFLGEEIVHEEIRQECPEVEILDDCPEGTCRVICGDTVCCYNSEGIAELSF